MASLRLVREGHQLTRADEMLFWDKVKLALLEFKKFRYATAPPKVAKLPLKSMADDEAAVGCDSDVQDDAMDEDVGGDEENNTLDCYEADLPFPADTAVSPEHTFLEKGTHKLGPIQHEASSVSMGRDPSIELNVAGTAAYPMLLQDDGTLSKQDQHKEEVVATQGRQIRFFYHRKRKNNPSQPTKSASASPKPGAFGRLSCEAEGKSGVLFSGATTVPKKRRCVRAPARLDIAG